MPDFRKLELSQLQEAMVQTGSGAGASMVAFKDVRGGLREPLRNNDDDYTWTIKRDGKSVKTGKITVPGLEQARTFVSQSVSTGASSGDTVEITNKDGKVLSTINVTEELIQESACLMELDIIRLKKTVQKLASLYGATATADLVTIDATDLSDAVERAAFLGYEECPSMVNMKLAIEQGKWEGLRKIAKDPRPLMDPVGKVSVTIKGSQLFDALEAAYIMAWNKATTAPVDFSEETEFLEHIRSLNERIKEENGKFVIYSEHGIRLGSYDTKEQAEKRLSAIEYFKKMNESEGTAESNPLQRFKSIIAGLRCTDDLDGVIYGGPFATKRMVAIYKPTSKGKQSATNLVSNLNKIMAIRKFPNIASIRTTDSSIEVLVDLTPLVS